MKRIHIAAFSECGAALAARIALSLGAQAWAPEKYIREGVKAMPSLEMWTKKYFKDAEALVFVSACGIAVRAIAPHIGHKAEDPAVVVLDDTGHHVISLLSGHLGGANDLALKIANITGGEEIITTATDVHGVTAIDIWAPRNNCIIENLAESKKISSEIINGHTVGVAITEQILQAPWPVTLWLRPKNLVLGIGCRKNIGSEILGGAVEDFLENAGVSILSLCAVTSIDLKKDENAIVLFAEKHKIPFVTYTPEDLWRAEGKFTASDRVKKATGVDNVCERAAVLYAEGPLLRSKTVYPGITLALARCGGEIRNDKYSRA